MKKHEALALVDAAMAAAGAWKSAADPKAKGVTMELGGHVAVYVFSHAGRHAARRRDELAAWRVALAAEVAALPPSAVAVTAPAATTAEFTPEDHAAVRASKAKA